MEGVSKAFTIAWGPKVWILRLVAQPLEVGPQAPDLAACCTATALTPMCSSARVVQVEFILVPKSCFWRLQTGCCARTAGCRPPGCRTYLTKHANHLDRFVAGLQV
eukprot:361394-Chlamydomonas_euryale.AAC.2